MLFAIFTIINNASVVSLIGKSFYKFVEGKNFFPNLKDFFLEMHFLDQRNRGFI